jgi:hypothetical protein
MSEEQKAEELRQLIDDKLLWSKKEMEDGNIDEANFFLDEAEKLVDELRGLS